MKQILILLVLNCGIKFGVAEIEPDINEKVTVESTTIFNEDEKSNITDDTMGSNYTMFFGGFEVTKIQMQVREMIQNFEKYRAEIALGSVILVATIFAISMVLSVVLLNRMTKNKKKNLNHGKGQSIAFPRDTDMEVNAVLSIYRAKKIEIQAVNNGKASTHRYDEGTDDDEVIYEYTGKSKIVDFEVVNPVYFVEGSEYKAKRQEKQEKK